MLSNPKTHLALPARRPGHPHGHPVASDSASTWARAYLKAYCVASAASRQPSSTSSARMSWVTSRVLAIDTLGVETHRSQHRQDLDSVHLPVAVGVFP
jgi:hypothetical protein